jgi:GTP cyclohydrolase I
MSKKKETNRSKTDQMSNNYRKIIQASGEDIHRDGLLDTPKRAAEAFNYLTAGYGMCVNDVLNEAMFECDNDEMVVVKSIELYSLCEHHLLPFYGECHIGYLPNKKVIGLSKMGRFVDVFARRLQVQERLTQEVMHCVEDLTGARGVVVMIEARHLCMMMRGVQKQGSLTVTLASSGAFRESSDLRAEFERLVKFG